MRLINVNTLEFKEFFDQSQIPPYAILSHTWGNEELSHSEWISLKSLPEHDLKSLKQRDGYQKIVRFLDLVRTSYNDLLLDGRGTAISWAWVDTVAIDKKSSAELTEAINSMWSWYKAAAVCTVFLSDVRALEDLHAPSSEFRPSRWFSRGWTLQELIAPEHVLFYNLEWRWMGTKQDLSTLVSEITGIPVSALKNRFFLRDYLIAEKMSWAATRNTTRKEDIAYCLLGLFGVNMPLLYGEGDRAFFRLQEEIMKRQHDHSIFIWTAHGPGWRSVSDPLLTAKPKDFGNLAIDMARCSLSTGDRMPFSLTNLGLRIVLPLLRSRGPDLGKGICAHSSCVIALLDLVTSDRFTYSQNCVCIFLHEVGGSYYRGHNNDILLLPVEIVDQEFPKVKQNGRTSFVRETIYCPIT